MIRGMQTTDTLYLFGLRFRKTQIATRCRQEVSIHWAIPQGWTKCPRGHLCELSKQIRTAAHWTRIDQFRRLGLCRRCLSMSYIAFSTNMDLCSLAKALVPYHNDPPCTPHIDRSCVDHRFDPRRGERPFALRTTFLYDKRPFLRMNDPALV